MSLIATAASTAVDAAIPTMRVSGAVTTARSASGRQAEWTRARDATEHLMEQELGEQEQRRAAEREDDEAERRVVAGMGDRELVADGDPDERKHDERQRPRAPQPDRAGVIGGLDSFDTERLGSLEVAPPERPRSP